MSNNDKNRCRICGLKQEEFPWGVDGISPTYDICYCCGAEFGNHDYSVEACREYRENWLAKGAKWRDPEFRPANWSLEEQLKHIPPKYLQLRCDYGRCWQEHGCEFLVDVHLDHLHIYDSSGKTLDKFLDTIKYNSPDAHIPYGGP